MEHIQVVEFQYNDGSRFWTRPMLESQANDLIGMESLRGVLFLSDIDCSSTCWCCK